MYSGKKLCFVFKDGNVEGETGMEGERRTEDRLSGEKREKEREKKVKL